MAPEGKTKGQPLPRFSLIFFINPQLGIFNIYDFFHRSFNEWQSGIQKLLLMYTASIFSQKDYREFQFLYPATYIKCSDQKKD